MTSMSLYKKFLASVQKWTGKNVDVDGAYNNQCVDWARQYALDIWYPITTFWNARWFATIWLGKNWERVRWEPWIGDIVIQPRGTYWHIAVVEEVWSMLSVVEQNRNSKASSTSLWSPVSIGKYQIRWDEVYFRPIVKTTLPKNLKARPMYNFKNYPILNQWQYWECAWYSILACLIRMKDWVDSEKIQKELIAEKWNELTMRSASEWFIKKGYIKWIRKATYSKSLMRRQPLITQLFNVNWNETNTPPYTLKFGDRAQVGSHWVCISTEVIANSHGANMYDHGYCYFTEEQVTDPRRWSFKQFYAIIV